jgi:transposase-like protein
MMVKWASQYPKRVDWVEANSGVILTFYRLPRQYPKHLKSTNICSA